MGSKDTGLDKFVTNELPKKYQTIVGERGVKLSGTTSTYWNCTGNL